MSQIRGLVNFIGDIRNCKTDDEERQRVEEELAKIRASFAKTSVGSYAKKKISLENNVYVYFGLRCGFWSYAICRFDSK